MRPLRAGDYSFNQIGPTGLYMLLSNIPADERARRGYYAVGGCGGNIAWHTVDDLMPVADLEILRRDLMVYLTTIVRILNAPVHPFDYTRPLEEMADAVTRYQEAAGSDIDLSSVVAALAALDRDVAAWRRDVDRRLTEAPGDDGAAPARERDALRQGRAAAGAAQLREGRTLRSRSGVEVRRRCRDSSRRRACAPAPAEMKPFARVGLVREMNKVRATLRAVRVS